MACFCYSWPFLPLTNAHVNHFQWKWLYARSCAKSIVVTYLLVLSKQNKVLTVFQWFFFLSFAPLPFPPRFCSLCFLFLSNLLFENHRWNEVEWCWNVADWGIGALRHWDGEHCDGTRKNENRNEKEKLRRKSPDDDNRLFINARVWRKWNN